MWECLSSSVCGGYVRPRTSGTPVCAHFAKWTHYYLHFILKADYLSRSICLGYDIKHVWGVLSFQTRMLSAADALLSQH